MKFFLISVLVLSTILTIILVIGALRGGKCSAHTEGFKDAPSITNPLLSVISKLRKMGTKLLDKELWSDRIAMSSMNPGQLARRYIYKQKEAAAKKL